MPRFAVLADLHGNLPATEAVLADLAQVRPDRIVVAGDFVNRGPQSRAVLERIAPLGFPAISGNHDTWLSALAQGRNVPPEWETSWWTPVRLAAAELSAEWVAWLEALPPALSLELPGAAPVRVVHGSPRHAREGMGRMRTDEQVAESLAGVVESTVIGAHIHYPYERWVAGTHVIVVGAVGCPFNGDVNAQYGVFTWEGDAWRFEHRSVPYDHAPLEAAWEAGGYLADGSLAAELMRLEHRTARTQYVPFWDWCIEHERPLTREQYALFAAERAPFHPPPLPAGA
ncbi:MAG TPA: metallophosphoesterase family protein [Ktedonobacterales bacterium]|nr:metallophosphoesterase family protein [Ktedonobacterales bacterium]